MTDIEFKINIQFAIKAMSKPDFSQRVLSLFSTLGYKTDRQSPFPQKSFQFFKDSFLERNVRFNEEKALTKEWKSVDLLFQLSRDEVSGQQGLFDTKRVDNTIIETYLFFAIELTKADYSRTALAQITREVNKVFPMPVMIVFKHGNHITVSVINRRLHKKDEQKDVLEKVTLIKDIALENPHRAHIDILFDLSFETLKQVHKFTNFVELHNAWQKTLDTKELNKRFYQELSGWYFWAMQEVTFPGATITADNKGLFQKEEQVREHNAKNLIRLLTRILFVWFIKEKKLIPDELFDENYIKDHLINGFEPRKRSNFDYKTQGSRYYRAILQNLFFATLNQTVGKREFRKEGQHMNVTNLMRYERYFKDSQTFRKLVEAGIPFMNGGLFECLDAPAPELKGKKGGDIILYEDGFSDRQDNILCVPDYIFFGRSEHADLSKELGDNKQKDVTVNGLIHILKAYKFTVTENTPIEEDIALDPELLGRVFENLLASYNPETKTTARKQTGSFYTPREIVNYMVDESLKAYLKQKLETEAGMRAEDAETGLEFLVGYSEKEHLFDVQQSVVLINAIDTCKILDPACGSGAFPMGMLHKLVHILHKLDPNNDQWREVQRQKAIKETEEAFRIGNQQERDERLQEISDVFEHNSDDYGRKLYLIENCIYGVDIQPIATQISKLRFFISLIVDQQADRIRDNFGIRPLPNLEAKFVAANTLIGIEKPKVQLNLYNQEIKALEESLKNVRHDLFNARTPATKRKLRAEDKILREEMGGLLIANSWSNESARQLAAWDPYDQNASSPFFDPEWMFGVTDGFDVVIGNPPYVRVQTLQLTQSEFMPIYRKNYKSATGSFDIYALFVEMGYTVLNKNGLLSYILPHKFFQATFGVGLRKILTERRALKQVVRFGAEQVFDEVTTYTCLLFLASQPQRVFDLFEIKSLEPGNDVLLAALSREKHIDYEYSVLDEPRDDNWSFTIGDNNKVMQKITQYKQTLADITRKIFVGLQTGADKIYVLKILEDSGDIIKCYSAQLEKEIEIEKQFVRPFLMGKDVHRYEKPVPKNVVIFPYWIREGRAVLMTQKEIEKNFPVGWKYLLKNKQTLGDRERGRFAENWWCFSRPQNMADFLAIKIMTPEIALGCQMTIDEKGICYHTTKVYSFVFNDKAIDSANFYLGILNSKVLWYFLTQTGYVLRGGYYTFKTEYLKPFPIPQTDKNQQKVIESLTEYVLFLKTHNGNLSSFFESLIDAMVYELYFPDEIKAAGCEVLKHLTYLQDMQDDESNEQKLILIEQVYKELSHPAHPVSIAMFKMETIEEIRIIEGKQ